MTFLLYTLISEGNIVLLLHFIYLTAIDMEDFTKKTLRITL